MKIGVRTERFTLRRAAGLGLGFAGALIILGVWRGVGGASLSGQLMCLAAACCYGIAIPYTKRFIAGRPESGVVMSFCQLLAGTLVLAVVAPAVTGLGPQVSTLSWQVVASVLALGALGTGIAFVLHLRNIRLVGASTASMVTYLIPVFATVMGIAVLGERLEWFQPLGALIVLAGVAVSQGLLQSPAMRETELWTRLDRVLGAGYSRVWASEYNLSDLQGRTVQQALSDGVDCKTIWRTVWRALELPARDR